MATDIAEIINRMGGMTFEQWGGKRQVEGGRALRRARFGCSAIRRGTKLKNA